MATLYQYLQARNIVSCNVYPGTVATDSSITWGTAVEYVAAKIFGGIEWSTDADLVNFKPVDQMWANYAADGYDATFRIRELLNNTGTGNLYAAASVADFVKVVALYRARGLSSGGVYLAFWGQVGPNDGSFTRGVNEASLTLRPAGSGVYISATAPSF
jgi:hypothetical protein